MHRDLAHKDFVEVLASDLAITALAERLPLVPQTSDDDVVRLLQAWAADIDAHPVTIDAQVPEPAATRRRPRGAARSVAAMTIVLTLSSSGFAAAVQGNPFAPITFVVERVGHLGHHERSSPVDLLGARDTPLGDPRAKQARMRAEQHARPSRDRANAGGGQHGGARVPAPSSIDSSQASGPGSGHTASSASPGTPRRPHSHHRHRPLVVHRPHHQAPVESPRPSGGETPPDRPEPPTQLHWPKPTAGERPAPPDKPMSSGTDAAPVR